MARIRAATVPPASIPNDVKVVKILPFLTDRSLEVLRRILPVNLAYCSRSTHLDPFKNAMLDSDASTMPFA